MILVSIAWRNVWRSKVRSFVILTAIAFGLFAGVFTVAFSTGMLTQRVNTAIRNEVSHIQLHHNEYPKTNEVGAYMPNAAKMAEEIQQLEPVLGASSRLIINAMAATAETGTGVQLVGINPAQEKMVTNMHEKLIDGNYFEDDRHNQIVIGKELAEKLNAKIRSKIVLTFQELDGTITGGAFRVAGIYNTANTAIDERMVYVKQDDLARLVKIEESAAHEVAVYLKDNQYLEEAKEEIAALYPNQLTRTWKEIQPDLAYMLESMDVSLYVVIGIILLALLFGIINTMLMVVLERLKELGMLMAIGMSRARVFMMILLETVMLSLTGGVAGIILAAGVTQLLQKTGINLSAFSQGLESFGWETIVYPKLEIQPVITITIMVIITGILASIYPAIKALKLKPADALRIE